MFSKTIIKQSIKDSWKIWLTITLSTTLFLVLNISLFDLKINDQPTSGPQFTNILEMLDIMFYGILGIILPMIYSIFVGNKLIAAEVDKGTLSYYLNTPITRLKIISSKAFSFISSLVLMFTVITVVGIITAYSLDVNLDIETFFLLNLGLLQYQFAVSGIVYLTSTYFNNSSNAMALGAGIPVAFFVLAIIAGLDDSLEFINNFTLNTLYDSSKIMAGTNFIVSFILMIIIGLITYLISFIYFNKKDLPI